MKYTHKYSHPDFKRARIKPNCAVELDRSNTITNGILACWIADRSGRFVNLVNRQHDMVHIAPQNINYINVDHHGVGLSGSEILDSYFDSEYNAPLSDEFTLLYFGDVGGNPAAGNSIFICAEQETSSLYNWNYGFMSQSSKMKFFYNPNNEFLETVATFTGRDPVIAIGRRAGADIDFYCNEEELSTTDATTSAFDSSRNFIFNGNRFASLPRDASGLLMAVWDRRLSDAETYKLGLDPFRTLLKPRGN